MTDLNKHLDDAKAKVADMAKEVTKHADATGTELENKAQTVFEEAKVKAHDAEESIKEHTEKIGHKFKTGLGDLKDKFQKHDDK